MHTVAHETSPRIDILPVARDEETVLANLLELYAHDFSEFHPLALNTNGRFGYKDLSLYWRNPRRHPFFIYVDGRVAGFALVRNEPPAPGKSEVFELTEFFVLRGYRRHGVGTVVARKLWERFPGQWEVRIIESNADAHRFWQKTITEFTGADIESIRFPQAGEPWRLFSFDSRKKSR